MEAFELPWARLPLKGAHNVRELGGIPVAGGVQTRHRRLLRADALFALTRSDERFLYGYGVRAVLDLRDDEERDAMPDVPVGPDVVHAHVNLLPKGRASAREAASGPEGLYEEMLASRDAMREAILLIAGAPPGCVLFHCSEGKDRTGILAMVLLALGGADKWDIVADYACSFPHLMRDEAFRESYERGRDGAFAPSLRSAPSLMSHAFDHMEATYGGVWGYLDACGVGAGAAERVRARLCDP